MGDLTVEKKKKTPPKSAALKTFLPRAIATVLVAVLVVGLFTAAVATLTVRSSNENLYETNRIRMDQVIRGLEDGGVGRSNLMAEYDQMYLAKLRNTVYYLGGVNAEVIDNAFVRSVAEFAGAESAAVIDEAGNTYGSWKCMYDFTRNRFNVLRGVQSGGTVAEPFNITSPNGATKRFYGIQIVPGRIFVAVYDWTQTKANIEAMTSWASTLRNMVANDTVCIAVSLSDYTFLYNPIDDLTGHGALQNGMEIECLRDGFEGELTFGGQRYIAVGREWNGAMIYVLTRADTNTGDDVLMIALVCAVLAVFVALVAIYGGITHVDDLRMGRVPSYLTLLWKKDRDGARRGLLLRIWAPAAKERRPHRNTAPF